MVSRTALATDCLLSRSAIGHLAASNALFNSCSDPTSTNEFKNLGDMTNFVLVGSEQELKSAFEAAKWHIADLDSRQSVARAVLLTIQKQDYMTMPMSQLYLFDRVQDFGYEQGRHSRSSRPGIIFACGGRHSSWNGSGCVDRRRHA